MHVLAQPSERLVATTVITFIQTFFRHLNKLFTNPSKYIDNKIIEADVYCCNNNVAYKLLYFLTLQFINFISPILFNIFTIFRGKHISFSHIYFGSLRSGIAKISPILTFKDTFRDYTTRYK